MELRKIKRLVESSFVVIPMITFSMPFGGLPTIGQSISILPQVVFSEKINIGASSLLTFNQVEDEEVINIKEIRANAIDAYFKEKDMPLYGYGMKMVEEAEKNEIDWRLLPSISVIETTGGKFMCKNPKAPNNPFGWGSCKIGFESLDKAIETIAKNLGGNNPKTAHHYSDKDIKGIIDSYNPPSIVPDYYSKVLRVMNTIGDGVPEPLVQNNTNEA